MRIIGLFGLIGSGKDTVSDYLAQKYGYNVIIMGDIVRELCTQHGLEPTRDNMIRTQREQVGKYGIKWFSEEVVRRIRANKWQNTVIGGMRRPEDAEVPKRAFGKDMILVEVDVDPKIRFERMKSRARIGDPKTFEEFMHQEELDKKAFDFEKLKTYIDYTVTNNGTREQLYKQVDAFLKKTGFA
jgi:dephospho-CoA kinase